MNLQLVKQEEWHQLVPIIREIRLEHPGMSARVMYEMVKPNHIGRDKFIHWCNKFGFRLEQKRNPMRTTCSIGVTRFSNKVKDVRITRTNQVWVSDITYYRLGSRFCYITLIMDMHSKYIVGHQVSRSLRTEETTIAALQHGLQLHKPASGLILHSDADGQYYCKEFLKKTQEAGIINSMTEDVAENNHAERLNGTIKNQYLSYYMPTSFSELQRQLKKAVKNYNHTRPH